MSSRATLHMVAKMHYEANMSQVDIARKLKVSTATVSRMLQRARSVGIVKIEVADFAHPDEISDQLVQALGLKRAAIIDTPSSGVLSTLVTPLGSLLRSEGLTRGSVIGIGWGRAVREVVQAGLPRIPDVDVVALNGGLQQSAPHFQTNEFVRRATEQLGGNAFLLHAPYLSSARLKDAFLDDPSVRDTIDLWGRLDCAIVGIGQRHSPTSSEPSVATSDETAIDGAVGDVLRHYFDINGTLLPWNGEERMIAASVDQLRKAKLSIGVAVSVEKARSIIGAARSGMIGALVTDTMTAQAVLEVLGQETAGGA
ncbi:MAG: sugar-binding transcriptional regulator [Pseudorhodobacter sp.]